MKELLLKILKHDFETVPFHNFRLILNKEMELCYGGTCSDRTIYLKQKLDLLGIKSKLHSAQINGKDMHRLLKITIEGAPFLLDVGLGWPLIFPISLNNEEVFNIFGLTFKTTIKNEKLTLLKKNQNGFTISYETTIQDLDENIIENQINNRFINTEQYPFSNSIRFSKLVNNEFYFLKGNQFGYSKNGKFKNKIINNFAEYLDLFENIFAFNINIAVEVAKKLDIYKFKK